MKRFKPRSKTRLTDAIKRELRRRPKGRVVELVLCLCCCPVSHRALYKALRRRHLD